MSSKPASDHFLRISTVCLIFLSLLTWVGPILDWQGEVQAMLGRINNLSMLTICIYTFLLFAVPSGMREKRERGILALLAGLLLFATLTSLRDYGDWLVTFGGLLSLFGAISAGLGAYVLGKSGKGLHLRLVVTILLTLPALALAPGLIALDPTAYKDFWLKVYGYSNIRVFGYFSAVTTVVLTGLLPANLRKPSNFAALALHLAALAGSWSLLFWSGSRAGMLAAVLAMVISWVIFWRKPFIQAILTGLTGAAGAFASSLYYTPGKWFGLANRVQDTAERLEKGGMTKASSNRFEMWEWAWGKILEAPWLGHGYLPMSRLKTDRFNYWHTHNVVVEYLLSFGLVAGSIMLVLAVGIWVRAAMAARRIGNPVSLSLLMLVTLLPIYAMFSATLFFPYHLMIFMVGMGALIGHDIWLRRPPEEEVPFKPKAEWMFDDLEE